MGKWIRFIEKKPSGKIDEALGSDSIMNVSNNRGPLHDIALRQAKSLRSVGKRYLGYQVLNGSSLLYARSGPQCLFREEEIGEG